MRVLIFLITLLVASGDVMANFSGSDNFNGAVLDASKWAPPLFSDTSLTNLDGHLTFSTSDVDVFDSLDWILNIGSYTQNWSVTVEADINVSQSAFSMSEIYAGISVLSIVDGFPDFAGYFDIALVKGQGLLGEDEQYYGVNSLGVIHDNYIVDLFDSTQLLTNAPVVSLRIAFNAQKRTLHSYFDYGDGFREVAQMRIVEWGLCDHDGFALSLFCGAEGILVESGDTTLDDFSAIPSADFPALPCWAGLSNFKGEDDFNDDARDSNKWDSYRFSYFLDSGVFGETGGKLVFTNSEASYFPAMEWIANNGSYTQDWSATVELDIGFVLTGIPSPALVGLYCKPSKEYGLFSGVSTPSEAEINPVDRGFTIFRESDDDLLPDLAVKGAAPTVEYRSNPSSFLDKLRIRYDASTKILAGEWHSWASQQWYTLGSMSVANWGMRDCDVFTILLVGVRYDDSGGYQNTLALDNFVLDSAVECPSGSNSDSDSDGMLDAWEIQFFGSTNALPNGHGDSDSLNNLSEYIAGTDPTNSTSLFSITNLTSSPSGFVINWSAVEGRLYSVNRTDSLTNTFQSLETDIPYPQNSYTDTVHAAKDGGFYQIEVKLAD